MKKKGLVPSLVLAAILAVGFAAVWAIVGVWALEVGVYVAGALPPGETLGFLPDGTPVILSREGSHRQFRDLQGNPIEFPEGSQTFLRAVELRRRSAIGSGEELPWDRRICSFPDGRIPAGYWYFVSDGRPDGSGYFVGYDSESRACLGYLGTAGFRDSPPPPQDRVPFAGSVSGSRSRVCWRADRSEPTGHPQHPGSGHAPRGAASIWDVYLLGRDGKLYHADLRERTLQVAYDEERVLSAKMTQDTPDAVRGTLHRPAVRTEEAILVLDERGRVRKRYPVPESLRGLDVKFGETTDGGALMYWESPADLVVSEIQYRACKVDAAGRCTTIEKTLPYSGAERLKALLGMVVPSPTILTAGIAFVRPGTLLDEGLEATYPSALARSFSELASAIGLAQLLAGFFALLCYRRQVRYGASRGERVIWPLFVLLLGLPGWIGYRFGRRWPALDKCPECGVAVPRDRIACARCEATFGRPALKGIEVFA